MKRKLRFSILLSFLPLALAAQGRDGSLVQQKGGESVQNEREAPYSEPMEYLNPGRRMPVGTPDNGRTPLFLGVKLGGGRVLPTNDFVRGDNAIPFYGQASIKFGVSSVGNRWQDVVYGMPYYGIALYTADFGRKDDLGRPVALYLLQGATITKVSKRITLNYEWNLGMSMGWKCYDPFDNPDNLAIGSETNVFVGYNFYFKWNAGRGLDMHFGVDLSHSSNGAQRLPNAGLNKMSVFVEAVYNFNRKTVRNEFDPNLIAPKYKKHTASEVLLTVSSRQTQVDTTGTNLPSKYLDRKFKVFGFNYAFMMAPSYRYRYGGSLDLLYDESSGVKASRELNPRDGRYYDRVWMGKPRERVSLGVSARGEVILPGYTMFANLGLQMLHGNKQDSRFYQILGVKIYLKENFFGTFGIRATHFSQAQYLFWSFGYTLDHRWRDK